LGGHVGRPRLDLYSRAAAAAAKDVGELMAGRVHDRMVWAAMKAVYSGLIQERRDVELAETFFNSVTRKVFVTVGVDEHIEFVDTDFDSYTPEAAPTLTKVFGGTADIAGLVETILQNAGFPTPFADIARDSSSAAGLIEHRLRRVGALRRIDRAEMVDSIFYRGKGAYLVGRFQSGSHVVPLVFAVLHRDNRLVVDAVLLTENQVSILFSFTRSYFHVDTACPSALVGFLATLMPRKRRAEIYTSLGYNKHGKTELYRELRRHLAVSGDRFEMARGVPGLVMVVFTVPGFDVVFKLIRDRFGEPKKMTRDHVVNRYRLVFRHDRAGRLVDAQEFEHLEFDADRFEPTLLNMLTEACSRVVTADDGRVHIAHCYVERRVTPLDIYLREADPELADRAVIDYGQAIKDLAAGGIFPGDMLLKNFGVTRHGRVVFYDYDELTRLEDCTFRAMPVASSIDDDMAAEPWFPVGADDVFPEEFARFLGLESRLRDLLFEHHSDLFDHAAWSDWQRRVKAGERIEIYPYDQRWRIQDGAGLL
jgi:isocitrate dehydrogenase kinase/phosphatase